MTCWAMGSGAMGKSRGAMGDSRVLMTLLRVIARARRGSRTRRAWREYGYLAHLARVKVQHDSDKAAGRGSVALPGLLRAKYPNASTEWAWQWVFPATRFYVGQETGERRRHHLKVSTTIGVPTD